MQKIMSDISATATMMATIKAVDSSALLAILD